MGFSCQEMQCESEDCGLHIHCWWWLKKRERMKLKIWIRAASTYWALTHAPDTAKYFTWSISLVYRLPHQSSWSYLEASLFSGSLGGLNDIRRSELGSIGVSDTCHLPNHWYLHPAQCSHFRNYQPIMLWSGGDDSWLPVAFLLTLPHPTYTSSKQPCILIVLQ